MYDSEKIDSIKQEYEHKNMTNYECILNILSKCKRNKSTKLIQILMNFIQYPISKKLPTI